MPEIKYTGAPTLTPEEARRTAAIPEYRLSFPEVRLTRAGAVAGEALGEATKTLGGAMGLVGRSIDSLGQTMEHAGNEMFQRAMGLKQLEAETKVNNAAVAWEQGQVKRDEEFTLKAGEQANSGALDAKQKTDEEARQKVRNALGSPYEQKLFDQQTTRVYLSSIRRSAEHAAKETKIFAKNSVEARANMIKNGMASAKEDADFEAADEEGKRLFMNERRFLHGQNAEQANLDYMTWRTDAIAARAQRMASEGDNTHALAILDAYKDEMDKVDVDKYTQVYGKIRAKADRDESYAAADKAIGAGKPDDLYEVQEKRLMDELKRTGRINQPEFVKEALSNLASLHARQQYKFNEDRRQAEDFVSRATHGLRPEQNKVKPKDEKELMAIPDMKEYWDKLSGDQQKRFLDVLNINARGNWPDTPEAKAEYRYWQGSMLLNPAEMRQKMLEDNTFIDKLKIPEHYRDTLYTQYLNVLRQGEKADEDTRVARLYNYGKQNFLIPPSIDGSKHNKPRMYSYLSSELDQWHKDHPQQMPKAEDFKVMINRARENVEGERSVWTLGFKPTSQRFQQATEPTSEFRNNYFKERPNASEEEMKKAFTDTYVWKLLHGEETKPTGGPKKVKTVPVGAPGG